jgi:hypothetical protein
LGYVEEAAKLVCQRISGLSRCLFDNNFQVRKPALRKGLQIGLAGITVDERLIENPQILCGF